MRHERIQDAITALSGAVAQLEATRAVILSASVYDESGRWVAAVRVSRRRPACIAPEAVTRAPFNDSAYPFRESAELEGAHVSWLIPAEEVAQ